MLRTFFLPLRLRGERDRGVTVDSSDVQGRSPARSGSALENLIGQMETVSQKYPYFSMAFPGSFHLFQCGERDQGHRQGSAK